MVNPPEPLPGARLLFSLDPAVSHLNHGSFGAVPVPVQRAQQRLRDEMEANPVKFFAGGALDDRVAAARRHLATFVGLDPDGCAIVPNATTGVSIALGSVGLGPGDEVLTTDHRYGAVAMAVERTCRETGAVVREVPVGLDTTDADVLADVRAGITGRTRLVVLDQITSPTARPMPVAAVHAALRGTDIPLLVDAAHAPGLITDPTPGEFWVGNLHKWAYAPRGTALLHVAAHWRGRVRSPIVSWFEGQGFPGSLEYTGVTDPTGWLAAPLGTYVLRTLGLDQVRRHNAALAAYGQSVVGAALGLSPADLRAPAPGPGSPSGLGSGPAPAGAAGQDPTSASAAGQSPTPASTAGRGPASASAAERSHTSASTAGHSPTSAHTAGRSPTSAGATGRGPADPALPNAGIALPMRIVPLPDGVGHTVGSATLLRRRIADELQAEVAINAWRGRGYLRLSANVYNRADEYERLAERLPRFLGPLAQG